MTDGRRRQDATTLGGLAAIGAAILSFSLGSTIVKSIGAPGAVAAFWRLLIGAAVWHLYLASVGRPATREAWRRVAPAGLLFGLNLACFFTGVTRTAIAHAEFMGALAPLVVVPVAAITLRERVPRTTAALAVVALSGVGLIVLTSGGSANATVTGDLFIAAAMALWSGYLLVSRSVRSVIDTSQFMAVMSTVAAVAVLPIAVASGPLLDVPARGWLLIVVMALTAGVIGHGLITWAQGKVAVGTISILQLAQPGLGTLWGRVFLGESVRPLQIVGMVLVITAVGGVARVAARQARNGPASDGPAPDRPDPA